MKRLRDFQTKRALKKRIKRLEEQLAYSQNENSYSNDLLDIKQALIEQYKERFGVPKDFLENDITRVAYFPTSLHKVLE